MKLPVRFEFREGITVTLKQDSKVWNVSKNGEVITSFKDSEYHQWLKQERCWFTEKGNRCGDSTIELHHEPPKLRGGRKDTLYFGRVIPLCHKHHALRTTLGLMTEDIQRLLFYTQKILPEEFLFSKGILT